MHVKQLYNRIKQSIWLYSFLYSFIALVLAALVILIDSNLFFDLSQFLPVFLLTSSGLARSVLSIVASAFITIMTFTFSTTMIVLTLYTSQFSPRVVENFLSNSSTMKSFGIFVSGFLYSIITLLFSRDQMSDTAVLSGMIGVIFSIIGILNFIVFISNVSNYIQVGNLIDRLYKRATAEIKEYRQSIQGLSRISEEKLQMLEEKLIVFSPGNGYIQEIDYKSIARIAHQYDAIIRFDKISGQFITKRSIIARIYFDDEKPLNEAAVERIRNAIMIGNNRTEDQDFTFSIQKITDVALKSLSPGINDPNTAIHCINNLGLLVRDLASIDVGYYVVREEESNGALYREGYRLDQVLSDIFLPIVHYGQADSQVMMAVLDAYRHAIEQASRINLRVLFEQVEAICQKLNNQSYGVIEQRLVETAYEEIVHLRHYLVDATANEGTIETNEET